MVTVDKFTPITPWFPTAQALLAEVAAAPKRKVAKPGRLGLETVDHFVPFQCKIIDWAWPVVPAAQALVLEVADTPNKPKTLLPGVGLKTWAHVLPFQRRVSVWNTFEDVLHGGEHQSPTAQALVGETAVTALSSGKAPGLGLETWAQVLPFQCKISVWSASADFPHADTQYWPTAHALVLDTAATAVRKEDPPGLGLETWAQAVPFQ